MRVVVASWNVHAWVGADGVRDPARVFQVIQSFDADVVALQEVEGSDWQACAEAAGFSQLLGPTNARCFGNALLARHPIVDSECIDLSVPRREARNALDAVISPPLGHVRVVTTHLGLRASERRFQATRLAQHLGRSDASVPLVLLGDFNDWTPWGGQLAPLARVVGALSRIPTFPSRRPVVPLDRAAWQFDGHAQLEVLRATSVRRASDHLPLRLILGT